MEVLILLISFLLLSLLLCTLSSQLLEVHRVRLHIPGTTYGEEKGGAALAASGHVAACRSCSWGWLHLVGLQRGWCCIWRPSPPLLFPSLQHRVETSHMLEDPHGHSFTGRPQPRLATGTLRCTERQFSFRLQSGKGSLHWRVETSQWVT